MINKNKFVSLIESEREIGSLLNDIKLLNEVIDCLRRKDQPLTVQKAFSVCNSALDLMAKKNTDYGDSWRMMRSTSITDQILVKVCRIKQIEEHGAEVSEGILSEYKDILNYSILGILKLEEENFLDSKKEGEHGT